MRTSKRKKNRWLLVAVYLILAAVLLTAGMKIYGYLRENQESRAAQEKYAKEAVQVNPLRALLTSGEWNEAGLIVTSSPQTDSANVKENPDGGLLKTERDNENGCSEAADEPRRGDEVIAESEAENEARCAEEVSSASEAEDVAQRVNGSNGDTKAENEPQSGGDSTAAPKVEEPVYAIGSIADTEKARTYMEAVRDLLKATDPRLIPPISVDFKTLKAENEDVVGWIYCEDTPINYPILQSEKNSFYLHHQPDKTYNASGSIFLDCKNAPDFSDVKSIIYGHNMRLGTMFGSLKNYKQQEYYDEHPVMYLFTPDGDYMIELFAGIVISGRSETYNVTIDDRESLIEKAMTESTFAAEVKVTDEDQFLLLSTCSYEFANGRYMLLGVMHRVPDWLMQIRPMMNADFQIDDTV